MPDPAEPEHVDRDVAADPFGGEEADQIVDAGHLVAVDGDDGVLTEQPADGSLALRVDAGQHRARRVVDAGGKRMPARDRRRLRGDADEGAPHATVPDELADHEAHGVAGDGKADALARAG